MKKQTCLITLGLLLTTPALAGGAGAPPAPRPAAAPVACQSIAQIVASNPDFSTLYTAVQATGLTDTLSSGEYTMFAPTNAAFAKLPSDQLAAALNDADLLKAILLYHVVPGKVKAADVMTSTSINTVQGSGLLVSVSGTKVMVDNATVTRADVAACNGVIHFIDAVLMPAMDTGEEMATGETTAEPAAAPTAAPTPSAPPAATFMSIPVRPQGATTTTTATTETAATTTTTETTQAATEEANASAQVVMNTCYDAIITDDRFSTLRDLLSDAGLTETLMNDNLTVFAPTNEAFDALEQDQLALISSDPDALKQLLTYHVVANKVTAEQLTAGDLTSAEGSVITVTASGDSRMIGDAAVDTRAVVADNCLIYPVNMVLMPEDFTMPEAPAGEVGAATTVTTETATATTSTTTAATATVSSEKSAALLQLLSSQAQFSVLSGLLQKAGLIEVLISGDYTVFAPTNDAFARLAPADLSALEADPAKLKAVLLGHVVAQRIPDSSLSTLTSLQTVQGTNVTMKMDGNKLMFGDAVVNGGSSVYSENVGVVLYPIDLVLLPK